MAATIAVGVVLLPTIVQRFELGHYLYRPDYSTRWVSDLEEKLRCVRATLVRCVTHTLPEWR